MKKFTKPFIAFMLLLFFIMSLSLSMIATNIFDALIPHIETAASIAGKSVFVLVIFCIVAIFFLKCIKDHKQSIMDEHCMEVYGEPAPNRDATSDDIMEMFYFFGFLGFVMGAGIVVFFMENATFPKALFFGAWGIAFGISLPFLSAMTVTLYMKIRDEFILK